MASESCSTYCVNEKYIPSFYIKPHGEKYVGESDIQHGENNIKMDL